MRSELGYDLLAASVVAAAASVAASSAVFASSSAALVFAAASKKERLMKHRSKFQNFGTQAYEKDTNIPSNHSNCCLQPSAGP
jgi:hypothetical protein